MKQEKLEQLPCPFCGSRMIVPFKDADLPNHIGCLACHASAPKHIWNTRPATAQLSPEIISNLADEHGIYAGKLGGIYDFARAISARISDEKDAAIWEAIDKLERNSGNPQAVLEAANDLRAIAAMAQGEKA